MFGIQKEPKNLENKNIKSERNEDVKPTFRLVPRGVEPCPGSAAAR